MATLYITSNADSGDGTLRNLIASASAGDIVEPDATVFPRGTVCEITLASAITVDKSLTIRGAHTKIRVDGGNAYGVRFTSGDVVCEDCEFVSLKDEYGPLRISCNTAVLKRCLVAGGETNYGCAFHCASDVASVVAVNCAFVGNKATNSVQGVYFNGETQAANSVLLNCTFAGNVAPIANYCHPHAGVEKYLKTDATGMKIPPVVDENTWTPDLWKEWDLHTTETTTYSAEDCATYAEYLKADIQGFLREVDSSGQIVDSHGAYTNMPIDLYWVGKDSNGDDVANPSFASEGWAALPTATTGSLIPSAGDNIYVGKSVDFVDAPPNGTLYVGDCVSVGITNTEQFYCSLIMGRGSYVGCSDLTSSARLWAYKLYFGRYAWANVNAINTDANQLSIRADENAYLHTISVRLNSPSPELTYGSLFIYGGANSRQRTVVPAGTYNASTVSFRNNERYQFNGAVFKCGESTFYNAPIDDWNTGTAPIIKPTTRAGCASATTEATKDNFIVDLSNATSTVALNNLKGQVVRNNVNGATLTGSARTSEVDLTKWTLNTGATLALVDGTMDFADGLINVYADKVLASLELVKATEIVFHNCFLGVASFTPGAYATTLSGSGYFGTPQDADLTLVADAQGASIKRATIGSDVSALSAVATANDAVQISGVQADEEIPVVVEYQDSAGAWQTLSAAAVLTSAATSFTVPKGTTQYRAFDGEKFVYDAAWWGVASGVQFSVVAEVVAAAEIGQNWQCVFEVIGVDSDNIIRVGQAVTILARVFDAFDDSAPLLNTGSNVSAIRYSCERKTKEIFSTVWEPVTGHSNVAVPATALLENVQSGDAWSVDQSGYNFSMTPDTTTNPLFPEVGEYRIVVTIQLATGNPVVFYVFVSVVDSAN